jgi:uncharacterized repeat protein (TIGR01451 family)
METRAREERGRMRVFLIMLALLCWGLSPARAAYVQTIVTQTAFQTVPTVWAPTDDAQLQIPIGFTFTFNGTNYTNVWVNSNGMLSFSAGTTAYGNLALPVATAPTDMILPYWDDILAPTAGNVTYGTLGTAPNRQLVVSWNAVALYNDAAARCSFQVVLGEDQTIRFRYSSASINCNGSLATTGIQENATTAIQRSFNTVIPLTQDVLYTPSVATLNVQKTVSVLCDPINGATNPKNIPGAISRWAITVSNTGSLTTTLTQLSDTLASNITFDSNFVLGADAATCRSAAPGVPTSATGRGFKVSLTGGTRTGFPAYLTSASDTDGATFTSPSTVQINYAQVLPAVTGYTAGELKAGETVKIEFNGTLN